VARRSMTRGECSHCSPWLAESLRLGHNGRQGGSYGTCAGRRNVCRGLHVDAERGERVPRYVAAAEPLEVRDAQVRQRVKEVAVLHRGPDRKGLPAKAVAELIAAKAMRGRCLVRLPATMLVLVLALRLARRPRRLVAVRQPVN